MVDSNTAAANAGSDDEHYAGRRWESVGPLDVEEVLAGEAEAIRGKSIRPDDSHFYAKLSELDSAALCLSGGGIRSAAFALGIIQAFAVHPRPPIGCLSEGAEAATNCLLGRFHYLSTVSGGGYTGCWLSAWRLNANFQTIWSNLTGRPQGADTEPAQLAWLRSYTNYLTPKVGVTSADTWTGAALWIRNLLLNWLLIIAPLCAGVLILKLLGLASIWLITWIPSRGTELSWDSPPWLLIKIALEIACGVLGVIFLVRALAFALRTRPSRRDRSNPGPDQRQFLSGYLLQLILGAFLLVHFLASDLVGILLLTCEEGHGQSIGPMLMCAQIYKLAGWNVARYTLPMYTGCGSGIGILIYATGWIIGDSGRRFLDLLIWLAAGGAFGALVAGGFYIYLVIPDEGIGRFPVYFLHVVFGVPWILMSQLLAEMLFVGLSSYQPGSDADREWFGRVAGWVLAAAFIWLALMFLVYFGTLASVLVGEQVKERLQGVATLVAAISGLLTAFFGKSALLPKKGETKGISAYIMGLVLPIAAVAFVVTLLVVISFGLDYVLFGGNMMPNDISELAAVSWWWSRIPIQVAAAAVAIAVSAIASWAININRFSLHAMYRNRLVRAFLGAARKRNADRFTGFDADDNPSVHQLWSQEKSGGWRPFHVINIALNIVSSRRLSWQERKAEPFTVSPLHTGSSGVGYRSSRTYTGSGGISLGTAMAISGAAASPNMGYHSSPAITFLMTMFNVRLGWWLGNPGKAGEKSYREEGPAFALIPLVEEAFGLTTDERPYVYLSDGGHFENLGLYEMVRRRCRYIVVSDAGCDPTFGLEDLANAVRKISIDLGVNVTFKHLDRLKPRPAEGDVGPDQPYYAIGEIDYRTADRAAENGKILYIKAAYHGTEGVGVRGYAKANSQFPHQSTIDQWFTESQFESYRALGFEIADGILSDALKHPACRDSVAFSGIFKALDDTSELAKLTRDHNTAPGAH